jgi:hypothetical protein
MMHEPGTGTPLRNFGKLNHFFLLLEFWPESKSPFYSLPTGENSGYFDAALATLSSLSTTNGAFDFEAMCTEFERQFGPGSAYSAELREAYQRRRALGQPLTPIQGKWLAGSMLKCLENREGEAFS